MLENELQIDYHIYKTYQILGLLGKGTYGQVYKVKNKKNCSIFAIKQIVHAFLNITDAKRTYRELNYLSQLSHPCIVKLYQVIPGYRKNSCQARHSNTSRTDFVKGIYGDGKIGYNTQKTHDGAQQNTKLSKHVYALFEYVQTDLSKVLRRCKLQPLQRKYVAYQILNGIVYLHKSKLIHRDVKPSNILIDTNCDIKICDFGLCRMKQEKSNSQQNEQNIITEYVASRWYRPPQILLGFSPCNQAIDMWGIGCVIAELILRNPIFQGESTMDQLEKVFRIIGLPNEQEISKLETQQAKFLLRTFTFSRKNKPQKISEVLSQASDQELDLIEKLIKFNPLQRLSAEQALRHKYFAEMEEMRYDYSKYNIPVKIIDHTDPSFVFGQLKNINDQGFLGDKNSLKKKEITLEQYQNLIENLERMTSRSSNRIQAGEEFNNYDKVLSPNQNNESERIKKQKSTRESNFLIQRKQQEQRKNQNSRVSQSSENKQTDKILQIYNKQKSCSSSHKNIKIPQIINGERNVYSMMNNYAKSQIYPNSIQPMINQSQKPVISNNNRDSKYNKSVQTNLAQTYGVYFNHFEKQTNKKSLKPIKKINQNLNTLQDLNIKRNNLKKISINKSRSKHSLDSQKQKSFEKKNFKNNQILQNSNEIKNKYISSITFHSNINESSQLNHLKGKIPTYKKSKDIPKNSGKSPKDISKVFDQKSQKIRLNKNNVKSFQNLMNDLQFQTQKQRKKSKQFCQIKCNQLKQQNVKPMPSLTQDAQMNSFCKDFRKIERKQQQKQLKVRLLSKNKKQPNKKTLQKKVNPGLNNKSFSKKKFQTKISSNH